MPTTNNKDSNSSIVRANGPSDCPSKMSRKQCATAVILLMAIISVASEQRCLHTNAIISLRSSTSYNCVGSKNYTADLLEAQIIPSLQMEVNLLYSEIPVLLNNSFARFGRDLTIVSVTHSQLRVIEEGAFRNNSQLRRLILDDNELKNIQGSVFSDTPHLWYLSLRGNKINFLGDQVQIALPALWYLDVSDNEYYDPLRFVSYLRNKPILLKYSDDLFGCKDVLERGTLCNERRLMIKYWTITMLPITSRTDLIHKFTVLCKKVISSEGYKNSRESACIQWFYVSVEQFRSDVNVIDNVLRYLETSDGLK